MCVKDVRTVPKRSEEEEDEEDKEMLLCPNISAQFNFDKLIGVSISFLMKLRCFTPPHRNKNRGNHGNNCLFF